MNSKPKLFQNRLLKVEQDVHFPGTWDWKLANASLKKARMALTQICNTLRGDQTPIKLNSFSHIGRKTSLWKKNLVCLA
jgi:hypothetical protein